MYIYIIYIYVYVYIKYILYIYYIYTCRYICIKHIFHSKHNSFKSSSFPSVFIEWNNLDISIHG